MPRHPEYAKLTQLAIAARDKNNDWPGLPEGHINMVCDWHIVQDAITDGLVKLVERPAKTNPDRTARFIVPIVHEATNHKGTA